MEFLVSKILSKILKTTVQRSRPEQCSVNDISCWLGCSVSSEELNRVNLVKYYSISPLWEFSLVWPGNSDLKRLWGGDVYSACSKYVFCLEIIRLLRLKRFGYLLEGNTPVVFLETYRNRSIIGTQVDVSS